MHYVEVGGTEFRNPHSFWSKTGYEFRKSSTVHVTRGYTEQKEQVNTNTSLLARLVEMMKTYRLVVLQCEHCNQLDPEQAVAG